MSLDQAILQLGLAFPFTLEDLKRTRRKLVRKYHPDLNKNGEEIAKLINDAYDILMAEMNKNPDFIKNRAKANSKTEAKVKKDVFTEEEKNVIRNLCKKLDLSVEDAALSYQSAQINGYIGSFIEWLEERVKKVEQYEKDHDTIMEMAKQTFEFADSTFEFIVRCYEQSECKDSIISWLGEMVKYKKLQEEIGIPMDKLEDAYYEACVNGCNLTFIEFLDYEATTVRYCKQLEIEPFIARIEFWKKKNTGYEGNINDWLKQKKYCKDLGTSPEEMMSILLNYYTENDMIDEMTEVINKSKVKKRTKMLW